MSRRFARELALQALFVIEIGKAAPEAALETVLGGGNGASNRAFVKDLVFGTLERAAELDAAIGPLLQDWSLERLPTIDLLVLRMSLFEMTYQRGTPRPVVINEAVELAKKFSTEDSGRFVNGVLSSAAKVA